MSSYTIYIRYHNRWVCNSAGEIIKYDTIEKAETAIKKLGGTSRQIDENSLYDIVKE